MTYECAIVPLSGMPNRRPAATSEVPAAPQIQAARAAAMAASTPWSRRAEKSTNDRSPQARATRAALDASIVWLAMRLSSHVSTTWASTSGAVTRTIGSPANTTSPSGTAQTSPVKRRSARRSRNSLGERPEAAEVGDVAVVEAPRLEAGEGVVEPAATRNRRSVGQACARTARRWPRASTAPAW